MTPFTRRAVHLIHSVPPGKVCTYGGIAALADNPRGARQVSRILHSMSDKYGLPWHRIISSRGCIAIKDPAGFEEQKFRLLAEGVEVTKDGRVDVEKYLWRGRFCGE